MPKQILGVIIVALIVVGLGAALFYAQPKNNHNKMNQVASGAALNISIEPQSYDFGTISMKNGKVTKSFQVKNSQPNDVYLKKLYTSCMCTSASIVINGSPYGPFGMLGHGMLMPLDQILKVNAEAELLVTFDPNAHGPAGVGLIERTVTLQTDNGEIASVNIKANVTP